MIIIMPDLQSAERFNIALAKIGNLNCDGRPIIGLDVQGLLKITLQISKSAIFIPAHIWTPHFSLFGAKSGFDTIEECFEDYTQYTYAIETGLSSDPIMNSRISELDSFKLVSNSDAHLPIRLGREANIFDTELSYNGIFSALKGNSGFEGTIEFFPEEGKYHYDGHRDCEICFSPEQTIKHNYLCPVCGKHLTIGVLHRVNQLADRESNIDAHKFKYIIPLQDIIAECLNRGANTATVQSQYFKLINSLGSEFSILFDADYDDIKHVSSERIMLAIKKMRSAEVNILPGYDGVYGKVKIFEIVNLP